MLFTEPRFYFFFVVVLVAAWATASRRRLHHAVLLYASYVFYAAWDARFLSLILISTCVDYVAGLRIASTDDAGRRRGWLIASLVVNLGLLGLFKYYGFFVDSLIALFATAGVELPARTVQLVLPVGISFYTFQTLSYTIDVYRRELEAERDPLSFAVFVAFFPQLVAGPIVRASQFLPQLRAEPFVDTPRVDSAEARYYLSLFLSGLMKKACIADRVGPLVDPVFAAPADYGAFALWTAAMLFGVQIYCDFSGYTDMALGIAGLLGYRLPRNFDGPYLATNPADFWHRWHISLSTWLRDYLYIPLGGNRGGRVRTYRNLMLTMLLGGLWHGAAWTFVAWGALHGGALAVHRYFREQRPLAGPVGPLRWLLSALATWILVHLCWVFFRAEGFGRAADFVAGMAGVAGGDALMGSGAAGTALLWLFLALVLIEQLTVRARLLERFALRCGPWIFAVLFGVAAAIVVAFLPLSRAPFIYFQF